MSNDRRLFADAGKEGQQTLEESRLGQLCLCCSEERSRSRLAKFWSEPGELAGSDIQVCLERLLAELPDQRAEELRDWSERQALVGPQADARTFKDKRMAGAAICSELCNEAALPDPGLATHKNAAGLPSLSATQGIAECGQFGGTPNEDRARDARSHRCR